MLFEQTGSGFQFVHDTVRDHYAAQARGTDIDKPRNLAKSVTVE